MQQDKNREIIKPFKFINESIQPYTFMDYTKPHVGEIHKTNQKDKLIVIDYNKAIDMRIQFQDGFGAIKNVSYSSVLNGNIRNPYHYNKYGGYIGEGIWDEMNNRKVYSIWNNMLYRATVEGQLNNKRNRSYSNCNIHKEWYNYQNFAYWYDSYINTLNPKYYNDYQLDKDILQWNQEYKVYGPNTCCLIPSEINICLASMNKKRIVDLPVGVFHKKNKYEAFITKNGKYTYIGNSDSMEEAFEMYKEAKMEIIRELADKYYSEGAIIKRIYDALYNLEIKWNRQPES